MNVPMIKVSSPLDGELSPQRGDGGVFLDRLFLVRLLGAQDLLLQREYVVQHPFGAPPFKTVVGHQARLPEQASKLGPERTVDAGFARSQRLLEQKQAVIEDLEPGSALVFHVPNTSTRPSTTLTCTAGRFGSG
jgi:hypothetical protein